MSDELAVGLISKFGLPAVLLSLLLYVLLNPEKAEKVAGWFYGGLAKVQMRFDASAVKYQVAGAINNAVRSHAEDWPTGLVERDIRISWSNGQDAAARLERGEVVVFMKRSDQKAANIANALMAYLPRAVAPRARRYVDKNTMRAADLTMAKGLLAEVDGDDALQALFDVHIDPAMATSTSLCERLGDMDDLDVHGWLTRILLMELKRLADKVYPGRVTPAIAHEAEHLVDWLHDLSIREHGSQTTNLLFEGQYLRVGIVFVAQRQKLEKHGIEPYRKAAKRYLYQANVDAVYLLARDDNSRAVEAIATALKNDGRVAEVELLKYPLRPDFTVHQNLRRSTGVIARLTHHIPRTDGEALLMASEPEEGEERYLVPTLAAPRPPRTPVGREAS